MRNRQDPALTELSVGENLLNCFATSSTSTRRQSASPDWSVPASSREALIIIRDRQVALCGQRFANVTANIAGATRHEDIQSISLQSVPLQSAMECTTAILENRLMLLTPLTGASLSIPSSCRCGVSPQVPSAISDGVGGIAGAQRRRRSGVIEPKQMAPANSRRARPQKPAPRPL
jgi:hypothetical protein